MAEPGTFAGEVQRGVRSFRGLHWAWHPLILAVAFVFVAPSAAGSLLGAGTFILLQRERWDAWRKTLRTWWFRTAGGLDPAEAAS